LGPSRGTARAGYWRLTDNWLELSVRFLTLDHGTRPIKDVMSRDIHDLPGVGDNGRPGLGPTARSPAPTSRAIPR